MVWDATGIFLFLLWLVLPPLYVVLLGRHYLRRCTDAAQKAVWAREELRMALEGVRAILRTSARN
ncbi:hypothetical protein C8D87_102541 [Lentzea atacamensis]|uniref:Uncharacterized protein n=1 Tax=Lentzea atacamensis TaxID=531938 RepID=A0ABX9EDD3_9PSEU|nr:hypothetical protein [Lentzea atacamensis]RAS68475.1 hypothetical protein C8D87_102541 [Lentzea atacamensis]